MNNNEMYEKAEMYNKQAKQMEDLRQMILTIENFDNVKNGSLKTMSGIARDLGVSEDLVLNPRFMEIFATYVSELDLQAKSKNPVDSKEWLHSAIESMETQKAMELESRIKSQNNILQFKDAIDFYDKNKEKSDATNGYSYVAMRISEDGNVNFYECNIEKRTHEMNDTDKISTRLNTIQPTKDGGFEIITSTVYKNNNTGSISAKENEKLVEYDEYGVDKKYSVKRTL